MLPVVTGHCCGCSRQVLHSNWTRAPLDISTHKHSYWHFTYCMMAGEFLQQFPRVIGKGQQDGFTPPGWPYEERPFISQCERCHQAGAGQAPS